MSMSTNPSDCNTRSHLSAEFNTNATQTLSSAVGEAAEGGQCGAHVLRGQPESLGDEEQHREVQEDEGGERGRLSGPRAAQGDALGERKVLLRL